ncbi:Testican-3 protein [Penaeus vannamei]|uniref:Testican-3 protein n=1 Tax=Penaeus vannamei TaxID=6689 RepID=A0A3R7Q1F8_PENVA|nr:Testican-3 protein [Penaeus vannamei]
MGDQRLNRRPFAEKQCPSCPVVRPVFLCGSDNRTYSSLCRLHYHNCIHEANVHVACKGFCPCKGGTLLFIGLTLRHYLGLNSRAKGKIGLDVDEGKGPAPLESRHAAPTAKGRAPHGQSNAEEPPLCVWTQMTNGAKVGYGRPHSSLRDTNCAGA